MKATRSTVENNGRCTSLTLAAGQSSQDELFLTLLRRVFLDKVPVTITIETNEQVSTYAQCGGGE